jgi:hypothetical protein
LWQGAELVLKGRWVALNSAARDALLTVKREQKVLGSYVFCSPEGRFLHNLERDWWPALARTIHESAF